MAKIVDTAGIESVRETKDGYLVADVRVARTGVQVYAASELGLPGGGMVNVYRPEATVFSRDSMSTFAGKPVTLLHPPVPVTADNWKQYAVGDIGEDIVRDGEFIRVPIKIMDASTIAAVRAGTKELSVGYNVDVEMRDGVTDDGDAYQAVQVGHLQVNHLAVVPKARGGDSLRIGDGVEKWGAAPITKLDTERKQTVSSESLKTVVVGDEAVLVTDAGARAIESLKKQLAARDNEVDGLEEAVGELKAKVAELEEASLSEEDIGRIVEARVELEKAVDELDVEVDTAGMTDAAIKRVVVAKKLGDAIVDGASDAEVNGMFKAVLKAKPAAADPVRGALMQRDSVRQTVNDRGVSEYHERLANAWKKAK